MKYYSDRIMEVTRSWIGTPFRHQGRSKTTGVDCAGLVIEVGIEAGVLSLTDEQRKRLCRYRPFPRPREVKTMLELYTYEVMDPQPGDIAYVAWGKGRAYHIGILSKCEGPFAIIHSSRKFGVIEEGIPPNREWMSLVGAYRYKGI
jgi:cell wall-associated NlpC family hydrolase